MQLAKWLVIALGLLSGAANAATVSATTERSYAVNGQTDRNFNVNGGASYLVELRAPQSSNVFMDFSLVDTNRDGQTVVYDLFEDLTNADNRVSFDTTKSLAHAVVTDLPNASVHLFSYLLKAGKDYVLRIDPQAGTGRTTTNVSAVPLPTAVWFFGSALFGFVMVSNRRKV